MYTTTRQGFITVLVFFCFQSFLSGQCPPLEPISGPSVIQACFNDTITYYIPDSGPANLVWSMVASPPLSAIIIGSTMGESVRVRPIEEGTAQLCATPTNPCYDNTPICIDITIEPMPTLEDPPNLTVCTGEVVEYHWEGNGTHYDWICFNPAIGAPPSGTGDLTFIAINNGFAPLYGSFLVESYQGTCLGEAHVCGIFVLPAPSAIDQPSDLSVCGGSSVSVPFVPAGNSVVHWTNSNPAIGLPASGTGNLNFTATTTPGIHTGTITATPMVEQCAADPVTFQITVTNPSVHDPPNLTVCAGEPVSVAFTGPGVAPAYTWTNNNPAIGLGPAGTGDIAFSTAGVPTTQIGTVTVGVSENGCTGPPQTFTITVKPLPQVLPQANQTLCAGDELKATFASTPPGATFTWTNNNPATGLPASGSGNIATPTENVPNPTASTVTVTPLLNGCTGPPLSFEVTVNPLPTLAPPPDRTVCGGDAVSVAFSATPGSEVDWSNSNPAIGLAGSGSGNIAFTAANVAATTTAIVSVSATLDGCTGPQQVFTITVNKCCATAAGTLDTATITLCGPDKTVSLALPTGYHLEPGDTLRYILYTNPANPLGSIVQYSDTLLFGFLADSMYLDSTYFVGVLAGPLLAGDSLLIDAAAKCFSLHKGPKVRWVKKPAMSVALPPEAVCGDGCVDVQFDLTGTPPFQFTWQIVQNGQVLLSRDEAVATGHQHTVLVCPQDFALPAAGNELVQFRVVWLVDRDCDCSD